MKKLFAVIGDPISHSMSPAMHNDLFKRYEIDAHYHPLHIKAEELETAIKGLKAIGIAGFNVTIPHKTTIIPFLDQVDPLARAIGAVNTVVNENGQLVGYNTDGEGFVKGLLADFETVQEKKSLVIGAGGAARAIYYTMAHYGVKSLDICNRTQNRALQLVHESPYQVETSVQSIKEAEENLGTYDLIIQTTSIGMVPNQHQQPLSLKNMKAEAFVSDIIYNPFETMLLQEAKRNGAGVQNGLNMFIFQGALAFQKWTGISPDPERMKMTVMKHLGGSKC
ncbi:shikimate dehydrogenase [Cytobacillus spongiae]|uniref:shikimate dehydrogenase n=1 Tax=Cytobacillus spongiae TaxID=2901381 RepID=UPI001F2968EA|nr:shikimate dehydrogenase [Cytobacillus spongiae]UII54953.1 shikimate dehydrogenase [Cytobacillus spongiae]